MKNTFALFLLIFGFGFFALIAAHLGGRLPFEVADVGKAIGAYLAVGVVALAFHDYARVLRRPLPPPCAKPVRLPKPRPAAPLPSHGVAAWIARTGGDTVSS